MMRIEVVQSIVPGSRSLWLNVFGGSSKAGRVDPAMATVGEVHRAEE